MLKKASCNHVQRDSWTEEDPAQLLKQLNFTGWAEICKAFLHRDLDKARCLTLPGKASDICPSQASPVYQLSTFPQWNCQNSHITKKSSKLSIINSPHICKLDLPSSRIPIAVKITFLSCTNIDCYKFIIFCSEIPAQDCLFNNFGSHRITSKFHCRIYFVWQSWRDANEFNAYAAAQRELQTLIFTALKLTCFHLHVRTNWYLKDLDFQKDEPWWNEVLIPSYRKCSLISYMCTALLYSSVNKDKKLLSWEYVFFSIPMSVQEAPQKKGHLP